MTTTSGGGTLSLVHGNALAIPLADQSVHLVVTSPPYHALRSYRDGDEHFDGQLGSEPTPHHFLAALWAVLDECWRILRDDGSVWINLGDKFAGSGGHNNAGFSGAPDERGTLKECVACGLTTNRKSCHGCGGPLSWPKVRATRRSAPDRYNQSTGGLRSKCRMLLPHRFALGLIDPECRAFTEHRAGLAPTADPPQWICRMDVVWAKLNGLPESVTDRVRASHEYWLHFTKSERYFAAMDEVREAQKNDYSAVMRAEDHHTEQMSRKWHPGVAYNNPLGKLPGSVWSVATEPLSIPDDLPQHFAAFPSEFPRRIVSGWSPSGVCVACGQPRRPVCETSYDTEGRTTNGPQSIERRHESPGRSVRAVMQTSITGYDCACPTPDAPTRPSVVVDPFSGTGTAPIVAAALGRHGVGVDLSWDYHRIARWRDRDGGLRAKALGVDRPERQVPGQLSLLDEPADDGQEELFG